MLATQMNYLAEENKMAPHCICKLKRHVTNILKDGRYAALLYLHILILPAAYTAEINDFLWLVSMFHYRRVVIILDIEVLQSGEEVGGKIGDPVAFTEGEAVKSVKVRLTSV